MQFLYDVNRKPEILPYLYHYSGTQISNMIFIVFLLFFGNGVPYVLGFCEETGYTKQGRGIAWWPKMDTVDPCGGL